MTTAHILKLAKLGGYNGNHFFRVDKGFVAQTASVVGGREAKLDEKQQVYCPGPDFAEIGLCFTFTTHQAKG